MKLLVEITIEQSQPGIGTADPQLAAAKFPVVVSVGADEHVRDGLGATG